MANAKINVSNLKKSFGSNEVLKGIDLEVAEGEVVCIIGPSGSGKSTLLRCLNKLEEVTDGHVLIDGQDITEKTTDINKVREEIGMVFQHFNLFPHLSVMDNITLAPVELKRENRETAKARALELLETVGLSEKADAFPSSLSGGQKQRLALAGILCVNPDIIILDEATTMLSPNSRKSVLNTLNELHKKTDITIIAITQYAQETVDCDRIVVMNSGNIEQIGTPKQIYEEPKNLFVGQFIGEANCFLSEVVEQKDENVVLKYINKKS